MEKKLNNNDLLWLVYYCFNAIPASFSFIIFLSRYIRESETMKLKLALTLPQNGTETKLTQKTWSCFLSISFSYFQLLYSIVTFPNKLLHYFTLLIKCHIIMVTAPNYPRSKYLCGKYKRWKFLNGKYQVFSQNWLFTWIR